MTYIKCREFDNPIQWFKNGDHPKDNVYRPYEDTGKIPNCPREGEVVRYYRHPFISGDYVCPLCQSTMYHHGFIDNNDDNFVVCPGDFIINIDGKYYPVKEKLFRILFQ